MQEKLSKDIVLEIIKRVGYCYAKDSSRPNINGILVVPTHDRICAVATDGHRLAVWNDTDSSEDLESVVMQEAVIEYVRKWHDDIESVTIESHNHSQYPIRVKMKTEEDKKQPKEAVTLRSVEFNLGDVDFPPYRMIIPNHSSISVFTHTLKFKRDLNVLKKNKEKVVKLFTDQNKLYMIGENIETARKGRIEIGEVTQGKLFNGELFKAE